MFYYLYKITNWFNGKIYIGVHKTKNLNDGYMGSGKILGKAFKKYGFEYFTKDIISFFDTYEMALVEEREVVNVEFVKSKWSYNMKIGGIGGRPLGYVCSEETRKKISDAHIGKILSEETKQRIGDASRDRVLTEETKQKISESGKGVSGRKVGHKPTEETRMKMSRSHSGRKNSEEARENMRKGWEKRRMNKENIE